VETDQEGRTSIPWLFAAGTVAGKPAVLRARSRGAPRVADRESDRLRLRGRQRPRHRRRDRARLSPTSRASSATPASAPAPARARAARSGRCASARSARPFLPRRRCLFRARPPLVPTSLAAYAGLPGEVTGPRIATGRPAPHLGQGTAPAPAEGSVAGQGGRGDHRRRDHGARAGVEPGGGAVQGASWSSSAATCAREPRAGTAAGVRAQWTTPTLIELAKESIEFMAVLPRSSGSTSGCAREDTCSSRTTGDGEPDRVRRGSAEAVRLPTRVIGPGEAGEIVPQSTPRSSSPRPESEDRRGVPLAFLWATRRRAQSVAPWLSLHPRVRNRGERRAASGVQTDRGRVRGGPGGDRRRA